MSSFLSGVSRFFLVMKNLLSLVIVPCPEAIVLIYIKDITVGGADKKLDKKEPLQEIVNIAHV